MDAQQIKALRQQLGLSVSQLASEISVDVRMVLSWETGSTFPTKKHASKLEELAASASESEDRVSEARPLTESVVAERARDAQAGGDDLEDAVLAPATWRVVQKLLLYPDLFRTVEELSESYPDPPSPPSSKR